MIPDHVIARISNNALIALIQHLGNEAYRRGAVITILPKGNGGSIVEAIERAMVGYPDEDLAQLAAVTSNELSRRKVAPFIEAPESGES